MISYSRLFARQYRNLAKTFSKASNPVNNTVGILIIGDEILKGQVIDTNSQFLSKQLHQFGLSLKKISVIGDNIEDASREIETFSKTYSYVLTSGGIGPTHDDITYEAIAKAFNQKTVINKPLRKLVEQYFKTSDPNNPGMKLARIPESSVLFWSSFRFPIVTVRNVIVFPGVPQLLEKAFCAFAKENFKSDLKFYTKAVYFDIYEHEIVQVLNGLVKQFPEVTFGSYPKMVDDSYRVMVTIEATKKDLVEMASEALLQKIDKNHVVKIK